MIDPMRQIFHTFCLFLLLMILLSSCKRRNQELLNTVNTLIGKRLSIPTQVMVFNDPEHLGREALQYDGYKILIYLNPYTCSACKVKEMRLWEESWQQFIECGVPTIVLVDTEDLIGYKKEVDLQKVKPLFAYDVEGSFKSKNNLPDKPELQSFLLKKDTVVLVGNPYLNPRILELYFKTIVP